MAKVRYFVDGVDAAVNFYIQHLGFELNFNAGPFAMIAKDDLTLWINFRNDILSGVGGKQIIAEDPSGNPIEVFQAT